MTLALGFILVLCAALFQGSFVLPMTLTRTWRWEHMWGTFSFFGMFLLNWMLALVFIGDLIAVYAAVPARELLILSLFGAGWGVGAILFGLGMDRLGMALGYPIIMGLIASMGALIPLIIFYPETILEPQGLVLLGGMALVIAGIVFSARAGARNSSLAETDGGEIRGGFAGAVAVAVAAGILSCLPNVGIAFGSGVIDAAVASGASSALAGNAVWAVFFTLGFVVNFAFCVFLMIRHRTAGEYFSSDAGRNLLLGLAMGAMWIGSFYIYGVSASMLGPWGVIVGWPLFIALSIVVGNLWGIWRGEWIDAPRSARIMLNKSMVVMTAAIIIIAISKGL